MGTGTLLPRRWDREYLRGRYAGEQPIPFVEKIMRMIPGDGSGLCVGCGNGRNYIPLARAFGGLEGIDISPVAIRQLCMAAPGLADRVRCGDFADIAINHTYEYIISIQMLQHGSIRVILEYFEKAVALLKAGGMMFLRVNSASTVPRFPHRITERDGHGGFTAMHLEGPKARLDIHFYTLEEITHLCKDLEIIESHEDATPRTPPGRGSWFQWKVVLRKS